MGKLYFHCGEYQDVPKDVMILGSLTATQREMSDIGKSLRAPEGNQDLHVFSNSGDVCNGVRIAVRQGHIDPNNFAFLFHDGQRKHQIGVGPDGDMRDMMEGFFNQPEKDLLQLF